MRCLLCSVDPDDPISNNIYGVLSEEIFFNGITESQLREVAEFRPGKHFGDLRKGLTLPLGTGGFIASLRETVIIKEEHLPGCSKYQARV